MNQAEAIERTKMLHHALDGVREWQKREGRWEYWAIDLNDGTGPLRYTWNEIKEWPETKARMAARLRDRVSWNYSFVAVGADWNEGLFSCEMNYRTMPDDVVANAERGLCMFREMLEEPKRDTIPAPINVTIDATEEALEKFKAAMRKPELKPQLKVKRDPYTGHDIATDKLVAAQTYDHPTNVRARKVAALRAELDRPMPHPVEGRNERALPRTNRL